MEIPEQKHFRNNFDTLSEMLLLRILKRGSVQFKIDELNNKAKEYYCKTTIQKYAFIILQMQKAVKVAHSYNPAEPDVDMYSASAQLFRNTYEVEYDDLLICASFENFIKGLLLSKGYMVHLIETPKSLRNKQKRKPVHFADILEENIRDELFIQHNTIGLGTIIGNLGYLNVLEINDKIIKSINICRSARNSIHFGGIKIIGYSSIMLEGLVEYSKIIDQIEEKSIEFPQYYGG